MSPLQSLFPNTASSSPAQLTESILLNPLLNNDVFPLLKKVQSSLDPFDISKLAEDYRSAYPNTPLFDKSVLEEISSSELSTFVRVCYHSDPATWTLRERLIAYTLSATFKDCSVFIRVELQPATGRPGYEPVPNGVSAKVIDLDVKPISKLAKWAELDEQIWRAWQASGDVGRDPCVI
jgi:inositol-pentakisphosphate 2-kinase